METTPTTSHQPFKLRHALQLAAPQTWPASVMSVLIGCCLARTMTGQTPILMACTLLAICILMQASVNTFNDYFDFIKGTDTESDMLEADDSTLINDRIDPRCALILGCGLLVGAFALGIWVIVRCGLIPLWIALIGAAAVVLYSAGKTPISALPLGEVISGVVMGGLIPIACVYCLTGVLDLSVLAFAIPLTIGIGLIMMTNNTCDIEKDVRVDRHTLPAIIGRERARSAYHIALMLWMASICIICAISFAHAAWVLPFMLLTCAPLAKVLWKNPLKPESRIAAMGGIASLNVALGAFYALCMVL